MRSVKYRKGQTLSRTAPGRMATQNRERLGNLCDRQDPGRERKDPGHININIYDIWVFFTPVMAGHTPPDAAVRRLPYSGVPQSAGGGPRR